MKNRTACGDEGFALIGILVFTFFTGMLLSSYAKVLSTSVKREKEYRLRYILDEYRMGFNRYKKDKGIFPISLNEMYENKYIRRIYLDPFTAKKDWDLVKKSGKITNIHSKSIEKPIGKQRDKEGRIYKSYSQW